MALSLLALPALPACSDDQASATERGAGAGETAAGQMVAEYCRQEATCGAIRVEAQASCEERFKGEMIAEYDNATCNEHVSGVELGRCLEAIHNGDCGNYLDSLSQLDSCRAARVCGSRR